MDKVYPHIQWLEIDQAIDYLHDLAGQAVSNRELLQLCESGECHAFVDIDCLTAKDAHTLESVTAKGIHLVSNPLQQFGYEWRPDKMWTAGDTYNATNQVLIIDDIQPWIRGPLFRNTEIQELADKLNSVIEHPTAADLEELEQQLAKAIQAKENAWHLTDKYKEELERLRHSSEQDRSSREEALRKAERAEKQVDDLTNQLARLEAKADHCQDSFEACQVEVIRLNDSLTQEQMARQHAEIIAGELRGELQDEHNARISMQSLAAENAARAVVKHPSSQAPAAGLSFPYATKELEAMCKVAIEYWADHTPDKRQHKQDAIQRAICKELGLDAPATKTPPNKAIYLATAIKPDELGRP